MTPVFSTTDRTLVSTVPGARKRPFANSIASSQGLIEATDMPPDSVAFRIAVVARRDKRLGSIASQTQAWVSSKITSIDLPNFGIDQRRFDVTDDFNLIRETSENVALRALDRHEP